MNPEEKNGWMAFNQVLDNFLGNTKYPKHKELLKLCLIFVCNMSDKVHFLHSYLEYFPENLGALSDEQSERFHQDIKIM